MLWLCFKLSFCLLGNTKDTSVMHEKAKFIGFIYMQPQKVKLNFVQINMKQVSYILHIFKLTDDDLYVCIRVLCPFLFCLSRILTSQ